MKRKRITIKDVAEGAGVSAATVSYVLNKKVGQTLSEATRNAVFETAGRLGYVPNAAARGMRKNVAGAVGLVSYWNARSSFFMDFLDAFYERMESAGYTIVLCSLKSMGKVNSYVDLFNQRKIDGVAFICPMYADRRGFPESEHLERLVESGIPSVMINGKTDCSSVDYLRYGYRDGAYKATKFLLEKGRKHICYLRSQSLGDAFVKGQRLKGVMEAGMNIPLVESIQAMKEMIYQGDIPDGIVCENAGIEDCEMLRELMSSVGEEYDFVLCNDCPEFDYVDIPIKSTVVDFSESGRIGADFLIERLNGRSQQKVECIESRLRLR